MKKHTPGPWYWEDAGGGNVRLATPHSGRLIVMDFVRLGMRDAQPRFAVWDGDERGRMGGIMRKAAEINIAEHPDAALIVAAPELLIACKAKIAALESKEYDPVAFDEAVELCRAAIAKAEGKQP